MRKVCQVFHEILTNTAIVQSLIESGAELLRLAEVISFAVYADEVTGGALVGVALDNAGGIDVKFVIEDVIASLESVQVPTNEGVCLGWV